MESTVKKHRSRITYWIGGVFIITGLLLLGKNLGYISADLFRIIVSWQTLLLVLSAYFFTERHWLVGFILFAVGGFGLLHLIGEYGDFLADYSLPAIFVVIGIAFVIKRAFRPSKGHWHTHKDVSKYTFTDGFFHIENSFGESRQVMIDEELKGGVVRNSFGGVTIDLRRASLPVGNTYIDVNGKFGGIEIYVPSTWAVQFEVQTFFAGIDDDRLRNMVSDPECLLIIRGDIAFSGIAIKS